MTLLPTLVAVWCDLGAGAPIFDSAFFGSPPDFWLGG